MRVSDARYAEGVIESGVILQWSISEFHLHRNPLWCPIFSSLAGPGPRLNEKSLTTHAQTSIRKLTVKWKCNVRSEVAQSFLDCEQFISFP